MSNADSLHVEIDADASRLTSAYEQIVAQGRELAESVTRTGVAGEAAGREISQGAATATAGLRDAAAAATAFGQVMQGASTSVRDTVSSVTAFGQTTQQATTGLRDAATAAQLFSEEIMQSATAAQLFGEEVLSAAAGAGEALRGLRTSARDVGTAFDLISEQAMQSFERLDAATRAATQALNTFGQSAQNVRREVQNVGRNVHDAEEEFKGMSTQVYFASFGFGLLGPEIGEASAMASNFFQIFDSIHELPPAIFAILGALTLLVLGFEGAIESVKAFSKEQDQLVSLNALIKNQGGAWQELSARATEYAEALSKTNPFSKGELVGGMQAFLVSGVSVNDTLRSIQAAMDLAKAKGESLGQASHELAGAYNGQLGALKDLGIVTADEVKHGIAYEEVLNRLEHRLGGTSAEAAKTFSGVMGQIGHEIENTAVKIGDSLAPGLEAAAVGIAAFGSNIIQISGGYLKDFYDQHRNALDLIGEIFHDVFDGIALDVRVAFDLVAGVFRAAFDTIVGIVGIGLDLITGNWANLGHDLDGIAEKIENNLGNVFGNISKNLSDIFTVMAENLPIIFGNMGRDIVAIGKNIASDVSTVFANVGKAAADASHGQFSTAVTDVRSLLSNTTNIMSGTGNVLANTLPMPKLRAWNLDGDEAAQFGSLFSRGRSAAPRSPSGPSSRRIPGSSDSSGSKAPFEAALSDKEFGPDRYALQQKTATEAIAKLTEGEARLKLAVDLATTSTAKHSAETAYQTRVQDDARASIEILTRVRDTEKAQLAQLVPQQERQAKAATDAQNAYNAFDNTLRGRTNVSEAEKARLKQLKEALDNAGNAYAKTSRHVDELRNFVDANNRSIEAAIPKTQLLAVAEARRAQALDATRRSIAESVAQEQATYGRSLEQQLSYYQTRIANITGSSDEEYALRQAFGQKISQLNEQRFKDDADLKRQAAQQPYEEGLYAAELLDQQNTYMKMTANQRVFLQDQYDAYIAAGQQYSDQAQAIAKKLLDLDVTDFKNRADEHATFVKTWNDNEAKLIDDIIANHQGLRSDLSSIWNSIVGDFVKMIERMIVEAPLIRSITGTFQDAFGGLFGAGASARGGASSLESLGLGAVTGGGGGGGGITGLAADVFASFAGRTSRGATVDLGASSLTAITGSPSGIIPNSITGSAAGAGSAAYWLGQSSALAGAGVGTAAAGAKAGAGGLGGLGSLFNFPALSAGLGKAIPGLGGVTGGSLLLGAGGGYLGGSIIGGLMNNGQNMASTGGALGGTAAALLGLNPLAGIGLAVGSSLLGGLFGSHDKPAEMPDKYDTQRFGTIIADLMGKASTNGQDFKIESGISSLTGGKGAIEFIEKTLSKGKPSYVDDDLFAKLAATFGTQTGGTLDNLKGKNQSQQAITGSNATAGRQSYTDIAALMQQFFDALTAAKEKGTDTPAYSLSRTYDDYASSVIRDSRGQLVGIQGPTGSSAFTNADGSVVSPGSTTFAGTSGYKPITVDMRGATIVGPGGLAEVSNVISRSLRQQDQGLAPTPTRRRLSGDSYY